MGFELGRAVLLPALLLACSDASRSDAMNQTVNRSDFAQAVTNCRGCDFTVDWWARGGEPGPGYTSDKLTVVADAGGAEATYIKARFDPAFETGFRALRHTARLSRSEAEELLRAIGRNGLFDRHVAAEDRGDLADGIKETVSVTFPESSFSKTLIEAEPDDFAGAAELRDAISRRLEQAPGQDLNPRLP